MSRSMSWNRKRWMNWVKGLVIASMLLAGASSFAEGKALAAGEFDGLRAKWKEMLTGGTAYSTADPDIAAKIDAIESDAEALWDTMNKTAGRTNLWSGLGGSTTHIKETYRRLTRMALGYAVKGSALENNAQLRDDLVDAMKWMNANRYNTTTPSSGEWWDREIGIPIEINNIVILMYDDFTNAERTSFMDAIEANTPEVEQTGANRIWKVTVVAIRGIIVEDSAKLAMARDGIGNVLKYSTSGDGFYLDGSFIQHGVVSYTGGYGKNLISDLANVMYLLEGSSWAVTDPNRANVMAWVKDSFEPFLYEGAMMDMVRGREISRNAFQDHVTGHYVMQALIRISQFVPTADSAEIKAMIKRWIAEDAYRSFYEDASINMIVLAKAIAADGAIVPRGELTLHKQFHRMDRVVHLRPGYGVGISMNSTKVATYESINGENHEGDHTGFGMTFLYNDDLAQYSDDFWPTVDHLRLPGTTVQAGLGADNTLGGSNAVGGAVLEDYGIVGMQLSPTDQNLDAKKAWFLFDDEIVALGADIAASDGNAVETIVENRKLNAAGSNAFTVNGSARPTTLGWSDMLSGTNWAHLTGNVPGSNIGYYFPGSASLKAKREARTGDWQDLNTYSPFADTTPVTRNYLTMWFDHGTNPTSGSYAYALLPNATSSATNAYASNPEFTVLENSAEAQGVAESTLGLKMIQFWQNQAKTVSGVTSDSLSSVVVRETADELTVSVADPTEAKNGVIAIELAAAAVCAVEIDPAITVQQLSPNIQLTVDVGGAKGKSHIVKLKKNGSCGSGPVAVYEVEDLTFTSSGDSQAVYSTDAQASGGKWRIYNANAAGDYIEHTLSVPEAGMYLVSVIGKHYNDRGIGQLAVQGVNIGSPVDFYGSSSSFATTPVGTLSFASAGNKTFRFTAVGKHASSSSYKLPLDAIVLERIGAAPAAATIETELASIAVSSGDTFNIHNDGSATGGKFTKLSANAVNDYIRYSVNVAAPGTYRIEARMKKYNDRGQFRLYIDGVQQGSVQDQYSLSETYATVDLGVVNVSLAGSKLFEFRVAGSSGSGYNLAFDHIKLQPE